MRNFNNTSKIITESVRDDIFPIPVSCPSGFFGLSTLLNFCNNQVDPLLIPNLNPTIDTRIVFDFRSIKIWDISALLWLTLALQYYTRKGLKYFIFFPDPKYASNSKESDDFQKSGDFLRRWKFDSALKHVDDIDNILLPEQRNYFSKVAQVYYKKGSEIVTPDGILSKLLSNRLIEIRDLTGNGNYLGKGEISDIEIEKCIREFDDAKIGNVLSNVCGININDAESFSEHLVTESLLNVQQHPMATTGLISISVLGNTKELILAVADNGFSIPFTILKEYNRQHGTNYILDDLSTMSVEETSSILHFATQPNVTSKPMNTEEDIGLGLTYIKEDTINKFNGKVRIISNSTQIIYKDDVQNKPSNPTEWKHGWNGNLIRISIPLKKA